MLPEAILFDLDDTILNDDAVSEQAWRESCSICAGRIAPITADELFTHVNRERKAFWNDRTLTATAWQNLFQSRMTFTRTALERLGCADDEVARHLVNTYGALKAAMVRLFPNAEMILKQLKTRGIKMALLTNGEAESQRAKVEKFGLSAHFPVCLIEGEIGFGKPDPRIYQLALDRLQVRPTRAWMLGDRLEFDILGAQNLGIRGIWCDYQKRGLPPGSSVIPDAIIHDISELVDLIAE